MPIPDKRVGHVEIIIRDCQQASQSPMYDDWFGTGQVGNQKIPFSTDHDRLEINRKYHIVYEKFETRTGNMALKIHDVIS
jgi:hypothetical protein